MSNLRSRKYVFTFNNYTGEDVDYLCGVGARYICFGKEVAPSTGTKHLQGFVYWKNGKTLAATIKLLRGAHVECARGTFSQCIDYCAKEGDFTELGERPVDADVKGDRERCRWVTALEAARNGALDEVDAQLLISHYGNLHRIMLDSYSVPVSLEHTCGFWIIGKSGSGKSRGCRELFPELYPKPLNKWWDGYRNEETVLIDDVDRSHGQWIGSFLKIWSDHYGFISESKGRSAPIRPKRLLVTSQYGIDDVFSHDGEMVEALRRRFRIVEIGEGRSLEARDFNLI